MNIFEIEKNKTDSDFIKKNGELELEVFADVIETVKDVPYLGSLFKLGKVCMNIKDWQFTRKLAKFLKESESIDEKTKKQFFDILSPKEYKRISEYFIHLLNAAEEEDKAAIMERIYKERLMNKIDNDEMLRLCTIVTKVYLPDLKKLPDYLEESVNETIEVQTFINAGLIDNYVGGIWKDRPTYSLNEIGRKLYGILNESGWFYQ